METMQIVGAIAVIVRVLILQVGPKTLAKPPPPTEKRHDRFHVVSLILSVVETFLLRDRRPERSKQDYAPSYPHGTVQGTILSDGEDIGRLPAWKWPVRGLAMAPEGRRVFPDLTVEENLAIRAYFRTYRQRIEKSMKEVYVLFPILDQCRRRVFKTLSGGEQQMPAIGQAFMASPGLLLVDEVSTRRGTENMGLR